MQAKPCPRCNRRIEKNGGSNHMTCRTNNDDGYNCNKFVDYDVAKAGATGQPEHNRSRPLFDFFTDSKTTHVQYRSIGGEVRRSEQFIYST
jgi:hypothetical protein